MSNEQFDHVERALKAESRVAELEAVLHRARDWIASEMYDKGWPLERIENPPEGSHLDAIRKVLAAAEIGRTQEAAHG